MYMCMCLLLALKMWSIYDMALPLKSLEAPVLDFRAEVPYFGSPGICAGKDFWELQSKNI